MSKLVNVGAGVAGAGVGFGSGLWESVDKEQKAVTKESLSRGIRTSGAMAMGGGGLVVLSYAIRELDLGAGEIWEKPALLEVAEAAGVGLAIGGGMAAAGQGALVMNMDHTGEVPLNGGTVGRLVRR